MQIPTQQRFAPVGSASVREKSTSKLSIMNPFRRQQNPSSSSSSNTLPPPAYSTNPSSSASVATSKRRPSSLFSWKSKRLSWGGFGSSKGEKSEQVPVVNKSQRKGKSAPAMPSAASNMVSIWKRRDPQVEFDFQPPFVVEFDSSSTPTPATPEPSRNQPNRALSPPASLSFPSRTTYSPSPVPSVSFDSKLPKSIPRATHSSSVFPSSPTKPIRKSDIRTVKIVEDEVVRTSPKLSPEVPSISSAPQASPDIRHEFADKFPLPPARRPSSAELVAVSKNPTSPRSIPVPTKSLLAPSRNHSSPRPSTSSLPRPKNGPYTASNPYPSSPTNSAFKSRLPTPSIASTTSSLDTRSPSRTSVPLPSNRKPIIIPARNRPSEPSPQPRVALLANNDDKSVRNSWSSSTTAMRNSGASEDSDDTVISKPTAAEPIDLRKRTSLIIPVVARSEDSVEIYSSGRVAMETKPAITVEEEKRRFEREVEAMFSEERMKDLLIQLGI